MIPVRSPAARASFNPAPSYELNPLISLAVPSRRESSQMRPSVSTPSTSISRTRIFFARAVSADVDLELVFFFGIVIDQIQNLSVPSVFSVNSVLNVLTLHRKIFNTEDTEKR